MAQPSSAPPLSASPRALSAASSPGSPTTSLGPPSVASSSGSSSASSSSTVRRESAPALIPTSASPRSFTVTRHPRKALSVSVGSPGAGAAARGYWSPPISSPLASPAGSPPQSPRPLLASPVSTGPPIRREKSAARRRRCPALPSAATTASSSTLLEQVSEGDSRLLSSTSARPQAPLSTLSSPGTPTVAVLRSSRPRVRRAASANNLGSNEWRSVGPPRGRLETSARDGTGGPSRPSTLARPSADSLNTDESYDRWPAAATSPTSPTCYPSSSSPVGRFETTGGGMQLLPSPPTVRIPLAASPTARSAFEDYFSGHYPAFALPPPLEPSNPWPNAQQALITDAVPAAAPISLRTQLTIRIDPSPKLPFASIVDRDPPEHADERSPATPVGPVHPSGLLLVAGKVSPASSTSFSPYPALPSTIAGGHQIPVPPRLFRKRSTSDPTPARLPADRLHQSMLLGKPLPPLPASTSTGEETFRSHSTSSCSSSASSASRVTEDTAATCSSLATTTEACDTPSSGIGGFESNDEPATKTRRRLSRRRDRLAVEGSAIETDSEGELDLDTGSAPSTSLDSPLEERSLIGEPALAGLQGLRSDAEHVHGEKASKLACQLWDLVEGEVAYTDDLVTLVQIYLHHLFMLPTFTAERRDVVARNTLDLLVIHKRFTQSLVAIASQEHLRSPEDLTAERVSDADLDRAARRIARVFVEEADEFAAYQEYCTGHEEALSVIRHHELTFQWMEYERKCSTLSQSRPRTSLTALLEQSANPPDMGSRRSSFKWHTSISSPSTSAGTPLATITTSSPVIAGERKTSRLMLRDLLIKPIQRICRYPLILDSMRTTKVVDLLSGEQRPTGGDDLEEALAVMKVVAGSVDEATRRKISLERSRVIRNRIEGHPALSRGVLSALGECLLVGSLDVIYHHPVQAPISMPIKIRYLAAFLYAGFFVLCKAKKGKIYSAHHFLPLERLEISEGQPGKTYLADSIRLQGEGYFLEVSAACAKEKDIWLSHLRTAQASPTLALKSPPSSAPELFTSRTIARRMSQGASPLTLKTSLSMKRSSGSAGSTTAGSTTVFSGADAGAAHNSPTEQYVPSTDVSVASTPFSSPRESLVGAPLPAVPNQTLFLRSPASYRETVDKALADVMSESCSTARNNALRQASVLFAPSVYRTTTSSSTIGAAVSSVRRKMGHQNGSMRRRSSFLDFNGQLADGPASADRPMGPAVSTVKLPRTKSEVGLKRESFLRRSSLMTHWPAVDQRPAPAVPSLPLARSPARTKSDRARSRTAPTSPVLPLAPLIRPPLPPPRDESLTALESSTVTTAPMPARSALSITPIVPSPTKPVRSASVVPAPPSRRTSVVNSWFPRNQPPDGHRPLSPILSPPSSLADREINFPRQSLERSPESAPVASSVVSSQPARAGILRRSLTTTFSRRKTKSSPDVPELALAQARATGPSSDGPVSLAPVSPVSPLELSGEFGAISARDSASMTTRAGLCSPDLVPSGRFSSGPTRPSFYLKSRSSSFASDDGHPIDATSSAGPTPSSSISGSAPSSDDGHQEATVAPHHQQLGPVRRMSNRSVRFLKTFTLTPIP